MSAAQRSLAAVVAIGLALAACSSDEPAADPVTDTAADADGEDGAAGGDATDAPAPLSTEDPAVRDAVLLTAVDEVLADTRFADLVDADPGAFLETADTLCASLDEGVEGEDVLAAFLTTLREEGLELDEDTAYLGGALFGAAVTVRCPEHEAAVTEEAP